MTCITLNSFLIFYMFKHHLIKFRVETFLQDSMSSPLRGGFNYAANVFNSRLPRTFMWLPLANQSLALGALILQTRRGLRTRWQSWLENLGQGFCSVLWEVSPCHLTEVTLAGFRLGVPGDWSWSVHLFVIRNGGHLAVLLVVRVLQKISSCCTLYGSYLDSTLSKYEK